MTVCLVMIVRDESARIAATLAAARPFVDSWLIVDTGSTDTTPDDVLEAMQGIPGELFHRGWRDFGYNRSEALALARGLADWLLLLDADMTVDIDPGWTPDPTVEAYMISMGNGGSFDWRLPLFVRGDLPWESRGKVHDYTMLPGRMYACVPTDAVTVRWEDRSSPAKLARQAELLEAELAEKPDDARTVFYLAQTYRELGDPRAQALYAQRMTMGDFEEECWYASWQAARLAGDQTALLRAWEARPWRLEPLYDLVAELNRTDAHHLAYALAGAARPAHADVLFIDRSVWAWGMDFQRAIAAWWVGERVEAATLNVELLGRELPDNIRAAVVRNLAL